MALELNEGGGNGLVYPFCFLAAGSGGDCEGERDDLRGGTSFGGTGGGDDISSLSELDLMECQGRVYRGDGIGRRVRPVMDSIVGEPKFRVVMHAYVDISQNGRFGSN